MPTMCQIPFRVPETQWYVNWTQSSLFLRKHSLSWREAHSHPTVRHKCKNHNSTNTTKERCRDRLFRALKNNCRDCGSSSDYSWAVSFHHLDSSCACSWPISPPTTFPRLHPHFEDWLLHPFLSSLRCLSAFSIRIPPLSRPLNHLVSRSRKIQPSTWFLNLSVSNSAQWPFSLGLGSWGLWVRENALRILFRKRGRKNIQNVHKQIP